MERLSETVSCNQCLKELRKVSLAKRIRMEDTTAVLR